MNTNSDYDPFQPDPQGTGASSPTSNQQNLATQIEARLLQAKADAFRDLADRFYMLWWNLPKMRQRDVDQSVQDMFRMLLDLAPSLGVSRNGIQELRECCGRKRDPFRDELHPSDTITGAQGVVSPFYRPALGWGLGDIVRRVTLLFRKEHCDICERRRIRMNQLVPAHSVVIILSAAAGMSVGLLFLWLKNL